MNIYTFEVAWHDPTEPDRTTWETTFVSNHTDRQLADDAARYAAELWWRNLHNTLAAMPDNRVDISRAVHIRAADYCYLNPSESALELAPYRFVGVVTP